MSGDLSIQLDRDHAPGIHRALLTGSLDVRTATGFDEWLQKYTAHFGCDGHLQIVMPADVAGGGLLPSPLAGTLVYYHDKFQNAGGRLEVIGLPKLPTLENLGFGNLDLVPDE